MNNLLLRTTTKSLLKSSSTKSFKSSKLLLNRFNSTLVLPIQSSTSGGNGGQKTNGLVYASGLMGLLLGLTALTIRFSERNGISDNRLHLLSVSSPPSSSPLLSSSSDPTSSTPPPPSSSSPILSPSADSPPTEEGTEEHTQSAAYNPETGEINWDCPCLGGMADGPCGEEFKAAFSCFVYSEQEPKGVDCVERFRGMQECFRKHPEIYGNDVDGDEETEEELVEMAEAILRTPDEEFLIST